MERVSGRVGTVLLAALMTLSAAGLGAVRMQAAGATARTFTDAAQIVAPYNITPGSDGALWFTNVNNDDSGSIGRIATTGAVNSFADPSTLLGQPDPDGTPANPQGIATGPDGALWIANTGNDSIGRLATSGGVVTQFFDPSISGPADIVAGPDGALWFTNSQNDTIGRITPTGAVTNFGDAAISNPTGIAAGPDGALWFTNADGNSIGRITTAGTVTTFTAPGVLFPTDITAGPDGGVLWFVNFGDSDENDAIGRITTAGVIKIFTDPSIAQPAGITTGPDHALWYTNVTGGFDGLGSISRITALGKISNYVLPGMSSPLGITSGPDGAVWFTNDAVDGTSSIGRITTNTPPTTIPGVPVAVAAAPLETGGAKISWRVPTNNGHSPIATYTVKAFLGTVRQRTWTVRAPKATLTVAGMKKGRTYRFQINATNAVGIGPSVKSETVTMGAPRRPGNVTTTRPVSGTLRVAFSAPADNGAKISKYTAECTSTNGQVKKHRIGTASPLDVAGLTPGQKYRCTVWAKNLRGAGPHAVPSAARAV